MAEVAHHALVAAREGEDPQAAYELSIEAAQEAGAVLAHAEAAGHYADALEALDELGAEAEQAERRAALEGLPRATVAAGEIGRGPPLPPRGRRRAARRRRGGLARAALGFAEFHRYGEMDREAIELLEQAFAALPDDDSARARPRRGAARPRLDPATAAPGARRCVEEATAMARRLGGGDALNARALCIGARQLATPALGRALGGGRGDPRARAAREPGQRDRLGAHGALRRGARGRARSRRSRPS